MYADVTRVGKTAQRLIESIVEGLPDVVVVRCPRHEHVSHFSCPPEAESRHVRVIRFTSSTLRLGIRRHLLSICHSSA